MPVYDSLWKMRTISRGLASISCRRDVDLKSKRALAEVADPKTIDGAVRTKEALAAYRGITCGVKYAEALWADRHRPQKIL
jgi:hypothetical protein